MLYYCSHEYGIRGISENVDDIAHLEVCMLDVNITQDQYLSVLDCVCLPLCRICYAWCLLMCRITACCCAFANHKLFDMATFHVLAYGTCSYSALLIVLCIYLCRCYYSKSNRDHSIPLHFEVLVELALICLYTFVEGSVIQVQLFSNTYSRQVIGWFSKLSHHEVH